MRVVDSPGCPLTCADDPQLLLLRQSLLDICDDVVDRFDADRQTDQTGSDAPGALLLLVELRVCRRGGVDRQ